MKFQQDIGLLEQLNITTFSRLLSLSRLINEMVINILGFYTFHKQLMSTEDAAFYHIHKELTQIWLQQITVANNCYVEPKLGEHTMNLLQTSCEHMHQTNPVFILAAELLEMYVQNTDWINNAEISKRVANSNLLKALCMVSISSKCIGGTSGQGEVKPGQIISLYKRLTKQEVTVFDIRCMELEVMNTLKYKIPISARKLDDLHILFESHTKTLDLTSNMLEVCDELLVFCQLKFKKLFGRVKAFYYTHTDAYIAFKEFFPRRLYLPCGILLTAAYYTEYHMLHDMAAFSWLLSRISSIHVDHISILKDEIWKLICEANSTPE